MRKPIDFFREHLWQAMKCVAVVAAPFHASGALADDAKAAGLTRFIVPGQEQAMEALEGMHALHAPQAFNACTLWDGMIPHATLWTGAGPRQRYGATLLARPIDSEGYVAMQQHRGLGHSDGWPFPTWQQSGGTGFHFSTYGDVFAVQMFKLQPLSSTDGWEIDGATVAGIDPIRGLMLKATGDVVTITTPPFRCGTIVAPFARIEWAARGLPAESRPAVSWLLEGETAWAPERRVEFPRLASEDGLRFANVPLYRHPSYAGILTRYRITIDHAAGAEIDLKSMITAIDTRHPTTGVLFIRACSDYFNWTGDLAFLRQSIGRMRRALQFTLKEFAVREQKHAWVRWVGHDGRSGLESLPDGTTKPRLGLGVGNNYWDLLPFGGHDAYATIYLHTALRRMAELERAIVAHPAWGIPADGGPFAADDLTALADAVRADFQQRFWSPATGRFIGWIDAEGKAYDYGFTILNLEAIDAGLPTAEQARSIFDWLDGKREVEGDTSRGADVYHWRFGPRSTTRRNVESYVWAWSRPQDIPWGGQVQDGGGVLGFSYYDVIARLDVNGPDDAWRRLEQITAWFREVQAEGGYRPFYAKPGRGTLQGGGPAGGLGFDQEFVESVLVPQVMLYGFLGFRPTPEGVVINPRLPQAWPSLTITGIHIHDHVVDVQAERDGRLTVRAVQAGTAPLVVEHAGTRGQLAPGGPPLVLGGAEAAAGVPSPISEFRIEPRRIVWQSAEGVTHADTLLKPHAGQPVLAEPLPPCTLIGPATGSAGVLLDFGRELQGHVELFTPIAPDKTPVRVRVRFGESASEAMADLGERDAGNDHAVRDEVVTLPWLGTKTVGPSGFRFVRIDSVDPGRPVRLTQVRAVLGVRAVPRIGAFRCSDERLTEIWNVGADTVHLCMQDYLWDGIKRDRLVWIGDMHPEVATIHAVFGFNDVVPRSLDLTRDVTPATGWMNGISSYSMWWVLIHEDLWRHRGDRAYLEAQRAALGTLLERLAGLVGPDGRERIDGTRFLDWPSSPNQQGVTAGLQALLVMSLEGGARLMDVLDDKRLAAVCREAAARGRTVVPDANGSKSGAALLVLAGMCDPASTARDVLLPGGPRGVSTFYGLYVLEALAAAGEIDAALDLLRVYWGGMLDLGATTFWEDFDLAWADNAGRIDELVPPGKKDVHGDFGDYCYKGFRHSLCHGWASGPTSWLSRHVLGVTPLEPGFARVRIAPRLGSLAWAEGTYPTPRGPIQVRHDRQADGSVTSQVTAPDGVAVELDGTTLRSAAN